MATPGQWEPLIDEGNACQRGISRYEAVPISGGLSLKHPLLLSFQRNFSFA